MEVAVESSDGDGTYVELEDLASGEEFELRWNMEKNWVEEERRWASWWTKMVRASLTEQSQQDKWS